MLLDLDPSDVDALKNVGEAFKGQGLLKEAQHVFTRLLESHPEMVDMAPQALDTHTRSICVWLHVQALHGVPVLCRV